MFFRILNICLTHRIVILLFSSSNKFILNDRSTYSARFKILLFAFIIQSISHRIRESLYFITCSAACFSLYPQLTFIVKPKLHLDCPCTTGMNSIKCSLQIVHAWYIPAIGFSFVSIVVSDTWLCHLITRTHSEVSFGIPIVVVRKFLINVNGGVIYELQRPYLYWIIKKKKKVNISK